MAALSDTVESFSTFYSTMTALSAEITLHIIEGFTGQPARLNALFREENYSKVTIKRISKDNEKTFLKLKNVFI